MDRFLVTAMVVLVLCCVFNKIRSSLTEIETFDTLLGGYMDIRYGSIGGNVAGTADAWIKVATVSLVKANQQIGVVLEVYGNSRQTFSVALSNTNTGANDPTLVQVNQFGDDKTVFKTAKVVASASSGLTTRYDMFLKMNGNGVANVPVAWYLQGVGVGDTIIVSNTDIVGEPAGGKSPQIIGTGQMSQRLNDLSSAVADLQNQLNTKISNVQNVAQDAGNNAKSALQKLSAGNNNCRWESTPMNDAGNGNLNFLDRHQIGEKCKSGEYMRAWHLNRNGSANQFRVDYMCCGP